MDAREARWRLYFSHALAAFEATGELPRGEVHPGGWLQAQRSSARRGEPRMTAERLVLLDASLPGWREPPTPPPRKWAETAAEIASHHASTKRLPRQNGSTDDERRLGRWLTTQRKRLGDGALSEDRTAWLDENLPGWRGRGPRDTAWDQSAAELGTWVEREGRWPDRRATDGGERRLGYWLKNRLDDLHAGRLHAARVSMLDGLAPGWRNGR